MKPGWKTTEFWLTAALDASILITAVAGTLPPKWAALAAGIANGLYAIARGQAKAGAGTSSPPTKPA